MMYLGLRGGLAAVPLVWMVMCCAPGGWGSPGDGAMPRGERRLRDPGLWPAGSRHHPPPVAANPPPDTAPSSPDTSERGARSSERLDGGAGGSRTASSRARAPAGESSDPQQPHTAQPCFKTCSCTILETQSDPVHARHPDHPPRDSGSAGSETDADSTGDKDSPSDPGSPDQIRGNEADSALDNGLHVADQWRDLTSIDRRQNLHEDTAGLGGEADEGSGLKWQSTEALHVDCYNVGHANGAQAQQENREQVNVDNWFQEMSDRLYNVSEVTVSRVSGLELPQGLCELESEVRRLTWSHSSFRRVRHSVHAMKSNNKGSSSSASGGGGGGGGVNLTSCLPQLISLRVSHNQGLAVLSNLALLAQLPPHLESLTLSHNNISVIPPNTFASSPHAPYGNSLFKLDLSHNKLQSLDVHNLANLTALKLLNLSWNELKYLHSSSALELFWMEIEWLDLSHNALEDIPSFLKMSPLHMTRREKITPPWNLLHLDLSHNKIDHINPTNMFAPHAVNLEFLDLSFNQLHTLPSGIFTQTLSNLLYLSLSHNHLVHLTPRALEGLTSLRVLNLSHNILPGLQGSEFTGGLTPNTPDAGGNVIFNYTSSWLDFHVLDLSYNNLSYVSRETFQSAISSVRVLLLGHNRIHNLPRYGIEMLPNVRVIDLQHNNIDWLDVGSFKNARLERIDLSHNRLVKLISMAFLFLPAIRRVDLSYNRLNYLYKFPFYKTCERDQSIRIDLRGNQLDTDAIWKMLGTFRHLQGTACSVEIHLEDNEIPNLLGHNLEPYREHVQEGDSDFFHMWNYVELYLQGNPLVCDCSLYEETAVITGMHQLLPSNWTVSSHFHTWRHLRCQHPSELKGRTIAQSMRGIHCKTSHSCPDHCACVYYPASHMTNVYCDNRGLDVFPLLLPHGKKAVYLQNNNISALPLQWNFTDIALLDLSNNSLYVLPLSTWQVLLELPYLYLYGNKIEYIPNEVINITPAGYVSLDNNPFVCGCQMQKIKEWIHYNKYHFIGGPTYCVSASMDKVRVHNYYWNLVTNKSLCYTEATPMPSRWGSIGDHIIVIVVCLILIMFLSSGVLFHRYRYRIKLYFAHKWKWRRFVDDITTKYDVCIWYNYLDSAWVQRELVPRLIGHHPPYRVSLLHEDMKPGSLLSESFLDGLEYSECSILVLSQRFFDFEWTYEETSSLLFQLLKNQYHRFVAIALEDNLLVNSEEDIELLKKCRKLRSNERRVWEKMFHALPRPKAPNHGCNVPISSSNHVSLSVVRY